MKSSTPGTTFRGLPLTEEQDREIRHYIHARKRAGLSWDTPELQAMLADMLIPPELADDEGQQDGDSMATERATAQREEPSGSALPQAERNG